ncbi:ribulose-phosphate 3-epimerase [Chloroflexota bacterium]
MNRLSRVVPAILTDDPEVLKTMVRQTEGFTDYVQFDIMDGQFVPSKSILCDDIAALSTKLGWEVHIMAQRPEEYLGSFKKAGAQKVVFHYEATPSSLDVISRARELGLGVGLAINPETQVSTILPLVGEVDSMLFLTVNPGFYGSEFISEVLDKVVELRSSRTEMEIGVDGGIKESNIARVAQFGVDVIYVGSAIFLQPQPGESFRRLSALAREGWRNKAG